MDSQDNLIHIEKIEPGSGHVAVQKESPRGHVFSELSSTYPLKLLSSKSAQDRPAIVYILTYGGGLVGGDSISFSVDVGPGSSLVLLSQAGVSSVRKTTDLTCFAKGSTKVFKDRSRFRASFSSPSSNANIAKRPPHDGREDDGVPLVTTQTMNVHISNGAVLFLLPDPVTCFKNASYNQLQRFHLEPGASLLLLDSLTSGRKSLGEEWEFSRYYSMIDIRVGCGVRAPCVAKDAVLLEHQSPDSYYPLPPRSLADKLAPYSCYATAILYGPAMQMVLAEVAGEYEKISVFKQRSLPDVVWSFSRIKEGSGGVIRVAGVDTERVRKWFGTAFRTLEDVIGIDIYRKAFLV